jgi:hypothetical protein
MTEDAVQNLKGEIPSPTFSFKFIEKADRLDIMLKRRQAMFQADFRKKRFAIMAEWRVADIMAKGNGFDEVFI